MEETGAVKFKIEPICIYSVTGTTMVNESFGKLFYAEIDTSEADLPVNITVIDQGISAKKE